MRLLTVSDVADELGICKSRVLCLIAQGRLPAQRIGKVQRKSTTRTDLRPWMIDPADLESVRVRNNKRGPKARTT